jgi:SHAQKYF class myb-like DNA-binding protein
MPVLPTNPPVSLAEGDPANSSTMQFKSIKTSIVEDPSTRKGESPSTVGRPDGVTSSTLLSAPKTSAPLIPIEGGAPTDASLGNGSVALLHRTDDGPGGAPRRCEEGFKSKIALPPGTTVKCSSKKRNKPSHAVHEAASTMSSSAAAGCNNNAPGGAGENTGRWTAEEHRLFLQGLDEHGKGWKKIAALIKSRTVVQIRTHAQKYFQKLAKARQNGEDGADTTMDCRTLSAEEHCSSSSVNYKKQNSGDFSLNGTTKRKSISSIVASATREQAAEQDQRQRDFIAPSQEAETVEVSYQVAPALLPFIPSTYVEQDAVTESSFQQQSQGLLSPSLLEESL